MGSLITASLINNASLLLTLVVVYEQFKIIPNKYRRFEPLINGLLIAVICVVIMANPYTLQPGLVFDTRSILISVTALLFGLIPTVVTAAAAAAYRLSMGGVGMAPGLAVIFSCALIGLAWRKWLYPKTVRRRWLNVYLMSTAVHVVMLACMMLLPYPDNLKTVKAIALPVLTVYPVTSALLSLLIMRLKEAARLQDRIRQSEERFRALFDQAPIGYQSLDINGVIIDVNQQWLDTLGYTRDEVIGKEFYSLLSPATRERFYQLFPLFQEQGWIHAEFEMLTKTGKPLFIELEGRIGYGLHGEFIRTHCTLQDVTEQKKVQDDLRASEKRYGSYIKNAPYGILIADEDGRFLEANDAASQITGYTKEELLAGEMREMLAEGILKNRMQLHSPGGPDSIRSELKYRHKDGSLRWAEVSVTQLSPNRSLCFLSDITNKKAAAEHLLYISSHDYLTGLLNLRFFEKEIERLNTKEYLPLSVLIADINGLKLINDSFGREQGDKIVAETAKLISGFCREEDVLARTGGDEFGILLPHTDIKTALDIINRIQTACREYNAPIGNESYHINLALGSCTKETEADNFAEVYRQAEDNMNQSKLLEKRSSYSYIISSIKAAMLEKSHETEAHEERLARMARKTGEIMGLSQIDLDHMELLAELHDIGKIGISEQILNKPGALNEKDWAEMRRHPEIGARIAMSSSSLAPIADYILCHHERWDGSGYPRGLAGNDIPLLSRILSVVDAYDAMTQDRVYRKAMTRNEAIAEIKKNAGAQFDPHIAEIFLDQVL